MKTAERQSKISAYLAERGYASLTDLVDHFDVSVSTARRDLDELQRRGNVRRTHGGAYHVEEREHPLDYHARESKDVAEKNAIGELAASFVREGESILLDGGTTTFELAKRLVGRRIQVVTNSLPIATALGQRSETEVVLLGGSIMSGTGLVLGRWAEQMLETLHISRAFLGTAGVMEDGLFNSNLLMVEMERRMLDAADEVVIVADHTKFGRRSLVRLCELKSVDRMVTDSGIEDRWLEMLRDAAVKIDVAQIGPNIEEEIGIGNSTE